MRVFGSSVIVDRLSDHISVHTIPMSRLMDRHSCYTPQNNATIVDLVIQKSPKKT